MPADASESDVVGALRGLVKVPGRVLAYVMKAMGRAYNKNYYAGAGGSLTDENAGKSRPINRSRRAKRRRR